MADEIKDNDISTASASLVSDVRDTDSTGSTVSESLKNICTILGCLSNRLTSLEKGQSESPVPNSKTSGGIAKGSEKPRGTDAARGGRINLDSARGESQTDSDDKSNSCVEVRDADETTDDPDILTLLEEDLEVGERLGPAVAEKLETIARGRFTVRLPEQKLKDKLSKYPPPECQELNPPVLNAELGDKGFLDSGAKKSDSD